ncbi:MAG: LuxR family transcriptional regulator [Pseudomonadota bacterium]
MVSHWGERFESAESIIALQALYSDMTAEFGFDAHSYVDLRRVPEPDDPIPFFTTTVREDFIRDYNAENFLSVDPVVRHAMRSTTPFTWYECPEFREAQQYRGGRKTHARRILELALNYGFKDGLIIPTHGFDHDGNQRSGFISLYWPGEPNMDGLGRSDLFALHISTMLYHAKMLALRALDDAADFGKADSPARLLRDREAECLLWASRGKTVDETATIIGLSKHSVQSYLKSACATLRVANKTQAVAVAVVKGLIIP